MMKSRIQRGVVALAIVVGGAALAASPALAGSPTGSICIGNVCAHGTVKPVPCRWWC